MCRIKAEFYLTLTYIGVHYSMIVKSKPDKADAEIHLYTTAVQLEILPDPPLLDKGGSLTATVSGGESTSLTYIPAAGSVARTANPNTATCQHIC